MKQKLAFIDHSFHRESGATGFLVALLSQRFQVDVSWDEGWRQGPRVNLEKIAGQGYNPVVFFQVAHYPGKELHFLQGCDVIVFPMFDYRPALFAEFLQGCGQLGRVKFVNFCRTQHEKLSRLGFVSRYFQYFPPALPEAGIKSDARGLSGFFWQRTGRLSWKQIRVLIGQTDFRRIHLHLAPDPPGCEPVLPDAKEMTRFGISISRGWSLQKEDYLALVRKADVFFAPRVFEGIGMSFLEAMSMGKCVVAADRPTMNEYIANGRNGLLFNPNRPGPLDFSRVQEIAAWGRKSMLEGHDRWLAAEEELLDFIAEPLKAGQTAPRGKRIKRELFFAAQKGARLAKDSVKHRFPGLTRKLSGMTGVRSW